MPSAPTPADPAVGEVLLQAAHDAVLLTVGDDVGPPQLPGGEEEQEHPEREEQLAGPADEATERHDRGTSACSGTMEPT